MRRSCLLLLPLTACATVEPGHRALIFDPSHGGLHRDVLREGRYWTGLSGRLEDFDVTFSTRTENIQTTSSEGLQLELRIAVIYRPVMSELYQLDSEIGLNYYDEVIGPEFRSAARGVFARHSYQELLRRNEQIEDEIEVDLRRRAAGKHVEISSVTLEAISYAPELVHSFEQKLAAEQEAIRQKTLLESEATRRKLEMESEAERAKLHNEIELHEKQQESLVAKAQADLDRIREQSAAEKRLIKAKAEAEETKLLAGAKAEQNRAVNQSLTPLAVQLRGYEALQALGGTNTHVLIGDWSRVPNFLFPATVAPAAASSTRQSAQAP
jgi:regulator of protease activity HflC (stomatin/prohibitin superfamily)